MRPLGMDEARAAGHEINPIHDVLDDSGYNPYGFLANGVRVQSRNSGDSHPEYAFDDYSESADLSDYTWAMTGEETERPHHLHREHNLMELGAYDAMNVDQLYVALKSTLNSA